MARNMRDAAVGEKSAIGYARIFVIVALMASVLGVPSAQADYVVCGGVQIVTSESCALTKSGCHTQGFNGSGTMDTAYFENGQLTEESGNYNISGSWIDGCGGNACDDEAQGIYDGGKSFQVREYRSDGECRLSCTLDGLSSDIHVSVTWAVHPQGASNADMVEFQCYASDNTWDFQGSMLTGVEG